MRLPLVGPTNEQDAKSFDVQRTINYYPMYNEISGGKEPTSLRGTPGLNLEAVAGFGPHRGGITAANSRSFLVSGNKFYELESDATLTVRGTLNSVTGQVGMEENNAGEVIIVDGLNGYLFDTATDTFSQITDGDFYGGFSVAFMDGYFIVPRPGAQEYGISGINDGASWGALDFGTASVSPDNLVAVIASVSNAWMLGETSCEAHANSGAAEFPFERIPGAVIQTGCAAFATAKKFDNTVAFLGIDEQGRGVVWKIDGYNAKKISTQAIERKIAAVNSFAGSYAHVYHEQGHVFYCLQIPGLDTTLVYDGTTGLWHERAYNNPENGQFERHRMGSIFTFANKVWVGDRENGNLYTMSLDYYDDAGDPIVRKRILPALQDEKRIIPHSVLELDMEVGVGNENAENPQIMLRYSDDGGRTFSAELWRSVGARGEYDARVRWHRLGASRNRVYELTYSERTQIQINAGYLNAN